jgi:hypothetical protein
MLRAQAKPRRRTATLIIALASGLLVGAHPSAADDPIPDEQWIGEDGLDGDAIYARVLENRFDQSTQLISLSSKDRSDHRQYVEMDQKYMRDVEDESVVSRSIAKYVRPVDVRHMGYLIVNKRAGPDDQFVYQPSSRRVRRINARTEAISGTDFTMEDVIPQEAADGEHFRLPDTTYKGTPAWVVAVVPHEDTNSNYSKFVITVEKERAIPLQTDYWDDRGVRIKQLRADPDSIEFFDARDARGAKKIWIVRRSKMMHLKRESQTVLNVLDFDADPGLSERDFTERILTASH